MDRDLEDLVWEYEDLLVLTGRPQGRPGLTGPGLRDRPGLGRGQDREPGTSLWGSPRGRPQGRGLPRMGPAVRASQQSYSKSATVTSRQPLQGRDASPSVLMQQVTDLRQKCEELGGLLDEAAQHLAESVREDNACIQQWKQTQRKDQHAWLHT